MTAVAATIGFLSRRPAALIYSQGVTTPAAVVAAPALPASPRRAATIARAMSMAAVVAACALAAPRPAVAQEVFGAAAIVAADAPVYLLPDASRTPLRTLPAATPLTLLDRKGDWLQVTFDDPRFGRRTAWIESQFVRIRDAAEMPPPPPAGLATPPEAAAGQAPPPAARPARRRPASVARPGIRLFGTVAADRMAASESFDAITGSDVVTAYGGGIQFTNLWRGLFVEGAIERAKVDGERVFVFNDDVFPLGNPVEIPMTPLDAVMGWRAPVGRVTPYVAAGATFYRYEETSDFADEDEDVDERKVGFVVRAGFEVTAARWLHLRGDLRYRQVGGGLGESGASAAFDEDRLGGFGAAVSLLIGR
ncbi:MAG: hypothetical protein AB7U83_06535 [Vicinamibacterales bacterium]